MIGDVEYHSADFSFEEWAAHAPEYYSSLSSSVVEERPHESVVEEEGPPYEYGVVWNEFYSQQGSTAYQTRRYLVEEFKSELSRRREPLKIVDVGAGVGATASTLIERCEVSRYVCTDCSEVGLNFLSARLEKLSNNGTWATQVWDITSHPWRPKEEEDYSFDICMCIFTLSAVHPSLHIVALENMASSLTNGGYILFRDYAVHDLTMYRHVRPLEECLYMRQDGTFAYYFAKERLEEIVSAVDGLHLEEVEYACVINKNRKTKQNLRRVFLHAVIRKQT